MKKIRVLMLALFALFTFSAVVATSAFGEETELLASGIAAKAGELFKGEGELLLADHKGGIFGEEVTLLFSWEELWEYIGGGLWRLIAAFPLGGTDMEGVFQPIPATRQAGICSEPVVTAVHEPWLEELVLEGTTPRVLLSSGGSGTPGWNVECSKVAEDTCTGEALLEVKNETGGTVDESFNEPAISCTRGGAGSGLVSGLFLLKSVETGLSLEVMGS